MENLFMCRMNRDFTVFMPKCYPQVADEQFEFGILKAEDNEEEHDMKFKSTKRFIFTVTYLLVLPAPTTYIMAHIHLSNI